MCKNFLQFLHNTEVSRVNEIDLINYRASLTLSSEWYLGSLRGFFKKWHSLRYIRISDNFTDLLNSWTIKGNIKGNVVKRLDPLQGPLTDLERQLFKEGIIQWFENNNISISDFALGLLTRKRRHI